MLTPTDARTIEAASECACPFKVADKCITTGCMSWHAREVETEWSEEPQTGIGWRLTIRLDRNIWVRFVTGGDCRQLVRDLG
jgi:hypothetical protein